MPFTSLHDYTDLINWGIILNLYFFYTDIANRELANKSQEQPGSKEKDEKEKDEKEDSAETNKEKRQGYIHLLLDKFYAKIYGKAERLARNLVGIETTVRDLAGLEDLRDTIESLKLHADRVLNLRERWAIFLSSSSLVPLLYSFIILITAHLELEKESIVIQALFAVTLLHYILYWILIFKDTIERLLNNPVTIILASIALTITCTLIASCLGESLLSFIATHWLLLVCLLPFINLVLFFFFLPINLIYSSKKLKKLSSQYNKYQARIGERAKQKAGLIHEIQ